MKNNQIKIPLFFRPKFAFFEIFFLAEMRMVRFWSRLFYKLNYYIRFVLCWDTLLNALEFLCGFLEDYRFLD